MSNDLRYSGCTDQGLVREQNEDNWCAHKEQGLFVVSDGMGGHRGGDIASAMVVNKLPKLIGNHGEEILKMDNGEACASTRSILQTLSHNVYRASQRPGGVFGMGATVVMVLISQGHCIVGHMGDSRLYLLRGDELSLMTHDHSLVQYLVDAGEITHEEAIRHEASGQISQYVGMSTDPLPDANFLLLQKNDRLLLCTDGLTNLVSDTVISYLLQTNPEPESACRSLLDQANRSGGNDNSTALIIDWLGETP
ncbi:MAG: Stp1/IreP family PP2C-type Ser/Thr phosphatase [Gammaproteobacteria bacterium]|nr:MAG: Stp1/IreP family PP2C-type Ser/Thr phosphatase [Gammaproteobacteria bacterium]